MEVRGDTARVPQLVAAAARGDREALDALVSLCYAELRSIARARRLEWRGDRTMSTTVLVNEAYLRLAGQDSPEWSGRAHFLAVASRAMRQILIDYSRQRGAQKRGGAWSRVSFEKVRNLLPALEGGSSHRAEALVELDECLGRLEEVNPNYCRIVECRFFGGMTIEETAQALGISAASVKRGWATARAWLHREMALS